MYFTYCFCPLKFRLHLSIISGDIFFPTAGMHSWHPGGTADKHWWGHQGPSVTQGPDAQAALWLAAWVLQKQPVRHPGRRRCPLPWGSAQGGLRRLRCSEKDWLRSAQMASPLCWHFFSQRWYSVNLCWLNTQEWLHLKSCTTVHVLACMVHLLQVKWRRQVPTWAKCLPRSQEMLRPKPGQVYWRLGSTTTAVQHADSASSPRKTLHVWTSCWLWSQPIRGNK